MNYKSQKRNIFLLSLFCLIFTANCQKKMDKEDSVPFTIKALQTQKKIPNAALEIVSPKQGEVTSEKVETYFAFAGLELSTGGPHLHMMLDDGDIMEHFDSNSPVVFENLSDGPHVIRAFLVDEYHLSNKSTRTFDMVQFYVNEAAGSLPIAESQPMLLLNVPSGSHEYTSGGDVLLDFWLSNARMGIYDYKIKYSLDGHEGTLSLWKSSIITGLSEGKHTLILDLIDPNGKIVLGNFNHTVRTFLIDR